MSAYKITIEVEDLAVDDKYSKWYEVYKQEIDDLDVKGIVASLNGTQYQKPFIINQHLTKETK